VAITNPSRKSFRRRFRVARLPDHYRLAARGRTR
jgi:hypothetical protein